MDHKLTTYTNYLTLLFFVCVLSSTVVYCSDNVTIKCSASRNEKWNKVKKTCVSCSDCPAGQFRNLTEPYTNRKGIHGDEKCLPCRPCPEGTFSENGRGECSACRTNCTEMFREYDSTCTSTSDAKCGSCLTNYEDTYGHILFSCSPKKEHRHNVAWNNDETIKTGEVTDSEANDPVISNGLIAGLAVLGLIAPVTVLSAWIIRRNKSIKQNIVPRHEGSYSTVSVEGDLEVDAVREDPVPKVHNQHVRPELGPEVQPPARAELLQPFISLSQLNGLSLFMLDDGTVVSLALERNFLNDFCDCRKNEQSCNCISYTFTNYQLEISDDFITKIASEICHNVFPLFQKLGLEPKHLYQENDSRNRDPEKITQKELVIRLLNIWIQKTSKQATLQQLSMALCDAKFHKINGMLFDLYISKRTQ